MNLPRMITALSAAHACMTDKGNWKEEDDAFAFDVDRANRVINAACCLDIFSPSDQSMGIIMMAVYDRHKCPDHRVYELAHFIYHMLPEGDMARPKLV